MCFNIVDVLCRCSFIRYDSRSNETQHETRRDSPLENREGTRCSRRTFLAKNSASQEEALGSLVLSSAKLFLSRLAPGDNHSANRRITSPSRVMHDLRGRLLNPSLGIGRLLKTSRLNIVIGNFPLNWFRESKPAGAYRVLPRDPPPPDGNPVHRFPDDLA